MRSSNPTLLSNPFSGFRTVSEPESMTIKGTANKTLLLLILVMLPAAWVWKMFLNAGGNVATIQIWMMIGIFGGLITSLVTVFKKEWAPLTAPLYAVLEGLFLGGISAIFNHAYPGIVVQAVSLSLATLLAMLITYQSGLIKVTNNFRLGVVAATGGIAIVYLGSLVLSLFGVNASFIYGSGLFSILFSLFVVGIAALNFILDFDFIKQGARNGAPKYMEWYGAFALMVTLVWLYIELLRLLAKLSDRR